MQFAGLPYKYELRDVNCIFFLFLQDFAICIEMFFAAIAHYFSFPHRPYIDPTQERNVGNFFSSLRSMFDLDDVTDDVRDHVRVVGK